MKAESCKIGLNKHLDGRWDWMLAVWYGEGFFADAMIKSGRTFETEDECRENMAKVRKYLNLSATPIQTMQGYIYPNKPKRKAKNAGTMAKQRRTAKHRQPA